MNAMNSQIYESFIIQKYQLGMWLDVEVACGEKDGLRTLGTCKGARFKHRLIKRTETLIENAEDLPAH